MSKRMKADNVEQLLDIVRAIQNGEEPDEVLRRKKEERACLEQEQLEQERQEREAEKLRRRQEKEARKMQRKAAASEDTEETADTADEIKEQPKKSETRKRKKVPDKKISEQSDTEDLNDDEFDRLLDEDGEANLGSFGALFANMRGKVTGVAGGVGKKVSDFAKKHNADDADDLDKVFSEEEFNDKEIEKESKSENIVDNKENNKDDNKKDNIEDGIKDITEDTSEKEEIEKDEILEDEPVEIKTAEDEPVKEESVNGEIAEDIVKRGIVPDKAEKKDKKALKKLTFLENRKKQKAVNKKLKESAKGIQADLSSKGIKQKELFMLGAGAVLLILVVILVFNGIATTMSTNAKKKNVTADEGLTVLVEQEPETWCNTYPVVLRVKAKQSEVQSVTIDGETYIPDEQHLIVVVTGNNVLDADVQTDNGMMQARIEIPMLDSQPPVVEVARDKDQITVAAADGRSSVSGIYYAVLKADSYQKLPHYQQYTEPLTFEENRTYYFYAKDNAGNISNPIVTNMEVAKSIELKNEELSLYPGETCSVAVNAVPSGALLNNLKYESSNPEVVTVDNVGSITAVNEGTAVVKVTANGVNEVKCTVNVSSSREVTVTVLGDCTLGTDPTFDRNTNFGAFDIVNGHGYFFKNVKAILENDDTTFANLEGPLTTSADRSTSGIFTFKGDPGYTAILQDGSIDVVTLANNHTLDYGQQGLTDTKNNLEEAGIDYCINDEIALKNVNGIPTAYIGIYVLNEGMNCEGRVRSTIEDAKAQGAKIIIVAFHWGTEKESVPDETQRSLAHIAVDCGASLVVGHHPHVIQGIEKYNGVYIAYSIGNFCFGGNTTPYDLDTIIFRQTFTLTADGIEDDDKIEIIPCSISSASGYNNYQPTPATGAEADLIMEKLNDRSYEFDQSFTASTGLD